MQQPDISQLIQLVQSPAGQQLIQLLQKSSSDAMQSAAAQASRGEYSQAKNTLAPLLEDPRIQTLLRQLGGSL